MRNAPIPKNQDLYVQAGSSLLGEDEARRHDSVRVLVHDSGNGGFVRLNLDRIGVDQVVDLSDLGFNEHAFLCVAQFLPVQFLPTSLLG